MINPLDMTGRTVLVTGASSGLGREAAILLSQLGARLILVGRRKEELEKTASMMEGQGHQIEPFDLSRHSEVPVWLGKIVQRIGPMDGLVHCAGMHKIITVRGWTPELNQSIMDINLNACFALANGFRVRGAHTATASLVFLSSGSALSGGIGISVYAASKGAILSLTKSLALELLRDGIRVNCIAAGAVPTEMLNAVLGPQQMEALAAEHPLGLGKTRDVANAIAFLLADTARWITGSTLVVDGGFLAK